MLSLVVQPGGFGEALRVVQNAGATCVIRNWGVSRAVVPVKAGIRFLIPGFAAAACGLARNDGVPRVSGTRRRFCFSAAQRSNPVLP
jgi:hypothetical protein